MTITIPGAPSFAVTLPYSLYAVPTGPQGRTLVSLGKNSQLRFGQGHQRLIRAAKRQVREDTEALMLAATWPEMRTPLTLNAVIVSKTAARRDDDGAVVALYPARDAIAEALGFNDTDMRVGTIKFEKGEPRTVITVEGM